MSITLITPVFNNAKTIGHCIESIQSQTIGCEHIIVDGGSTDGTLEEIEAKHSPDTIVTSGPDQGMYDAINKGIAQAQGSIIGILNSDDFYANSSALEQILETFEDRSIDACYSDLFYVDPKDTNKVIRRWYSGEFQRERFYQGWMPPHPTFFLRKRMYEKHGNYRLDLGTAADYELMLRMLLRHRCRAAYIREVLVHMRNSGMSNASLRNRIAANRNDRKAWTVNGIRPKPWTLIAKPASKLIQWLPTLR